MINIKNLSKKYGDSVIFEDASFSFPDQGLICVLGPSGCGKSTLLNLIAGFDSDYRGEVNVHGTSLSGLDSAKLCAYRRDNVGFIFQNYHLISGYTVTENIALASEIGGESMEKRNQKTAELLETLGIPEKAGEKIENLSGGQKQRVAIARALVNDPSMILADEPTGALDRKNSTEIMELLREMSKKRLVIVITHDKKCAEYADQIVAIKDGKLVAEPSDSEQADAGQTDGKSSESRMSDGDRKSLTGTKTAELKGKETPQISLWKRAFQNFKVHLFRYLAVALAVSFGVVCFVLSLSSGNRMDQSIAEFEKKNTAYHNGYIKAEGKEKELLEVLNSDERVEHVYSQYVLREISVKMEEQSVELPEKYPMPKTAEKMSYGVMPRRGENEIALNPSLAAKFDKEIQNLIGKKAELTYQGQTYEVTVSGIFNGTYDDYFVSSDMEQKMYEGISEKVYSVSYDVKEFEEIVPVSESLKEQGIYSQNASAEAAAFLSTFQNLNRLFLTVSVLIFAIGIFISAILLVKQQNTRYREIGLLSALGYPAGKIRRLFFYENLLLALLSVIFGAILTALVQSIGKAAGFALAFSAGELTASLGLTAVLILLIAVCAGIKPVNTEPAEALRK